MNYNQFGDPDTCIKVYNPELRECIATYDTFQKAGNDMGLLPVQVLKRCQSKTRIFAPKFNMKVACRLAAKEKAKITFTSTTT